MAFREFSRAAQPARLFSSPAKPYSERMAAKGRLVSPHVTIYAFPAVAISSITVRVTGFFTDLFRYFNNNKDFRAHSYY